MCQHVALRLALILVPILLFGPTADAQDARPPDPPPEAPLKSKVPSAPVGHRQPRPSDLTGQATKDDFAERLDQINRSLEQKLQICRRC
jgi:hypothetical protein